MPTYRIKGDFHYQAWQETTHSARILRSIARDTTSGHTHVVAAAVVATAFSIEAFAQTLGPRAYGESWTSGDRPGERHPIKLKIKTIAAKFGVVVDYGMHPWKDIADLLSARNTAAHPAPHPRPIDELFEAADEHIARMAAGDVVFKKFHPLHDIDVLDETAAKVEEALVQIWIASGGDRKVLSWWPSGRFSLTKEE